MKLLAAILTIFILTFSGNIFACDCESAGEFLIVAPQTKLVALVKVSKYLTFKNIYGKPVPMSMEVEIMDLYKGKETRKTVTVWGDNGALCRPYLSQFSIGSYYVIAFESSDIQILNANSNKDTTDYAISICGDYWLNVDKDLQHAVGGVAKDQTTITLAKLKKYFVK